MTPIWRVPVSDNLSTDGAAKKLDTGIPHSARLWNYWLGGKDNFAADRPRQAAT
jgi:hypothetical protein